MSPTSEQDELSQLKDAIESFSSLPDYIDHYCSEQSEKNAYANMGGVLSYADLQRYSINFAAYLQNETDLIPGDRIAIQLPNLLQYPVVVMGALRAGLVVVNTNPLYTTEETIEQFNGAGVTAVIILSNSAHMFEDVLPATDVHTVIVTQMADLHPLPRRLLINCMARYIRKIVPRYKLSGSISFRYALKRGSRLTLKKRPFSPEATALIQYTVGTMGTPKAAQLSHRNLIANALQVRSRLTEICRENEEIAIAPLPLYHIYSFTLNLLVLPAFGAQIVLITNPRDTSGFVNELARWKFTFFSGLNTLFVSLCQSTQFQQLDLSSLKVTISGGMALTRSVSEQWETITGCEITQGYGLTEASPVISVSVPGDQPFGSVGCPLPLTEVKVLGEQLDELCSGETGELYVRGPQVMSGYWGDDTSVDDEDGWLATGDIARVCDDGSIRIVDRKDDIINISGFPIYPNELENVISSHPAISECAAVGLPDEVSGEIIKLYVVTHDKRLSVKEVREYCRERLTSYKVPRLVEFRTHLPKSNVGKVIRRALLEEEISKAQKLRRHL